MSIVRRLKSFKYIATVTRVNVRPPMLPLHYAPSVSVNVCVCV